MMLWIEAIDPHVIMKFWVYWNGKDVNEDWHMNLIIPIYNGDGCILVQIRDMRCVCVDLVKVFDGVPHKLLKWLWEGKIYQRHYWCICMNNYVNIQHGIMNKRRLDEGNCWCAGLCAITSFFVIHWCHYAGEWWLWSSCVSKS